MIIAVTRLAGKEKNDAERCASYGHTCYSVNPLRSELMTDEINAFVEAVDRNEFDCLFFTSALPAKLIAPLLNRIPRIIAIGPQTAKELQQSEIECEVLSSFYSRDFVPYLGEWIRGKHIGIPRADVPNPALIEAIISAGGIAREFHCYRLEPTGETLDLKNAEAILFTSAMSFAKAVWTRDKELIVIAIGEVTADAMRRSGINPVVIGDGSLEGSLRALNEYVAKKREY